MTTDSYDLTLKIKRFDPDAGRRWRQTYRLTAGRILRFTDVLRRINDEQDASLAWVSSCEHGQCGSCAMRVNGKPLLACELLVEDAVAAFGTTTFRLDPLPVAPVVRDLVVDLKTAYRRVERAKPYLLDPAADAASATELPVLPARLERYVEATRCINCFCCAAACLSGTRAFLGPNALLACIVRQMDPREQATGERTRILAGDEGVARCHTSRACSFVCPKEIDVAHFIALAKAGVTR